MSNVRKTPIAILCGDLHLRHTVPSGRAEKSWYPVMEEALGVLKGKATEYDVPIICSGDVFDRWNPPAELVSWAIDHLPQMYAIPGQHDCPFHDVERRMDGAYGALVKAGNIIDLDAESWYCIPTNQGANLWVWGNPWGRYALPDDFPDEYTDGDITLQVLHKYVWREADPKTGYCNAPLEAGWGRTLRTSYISHTLIGDNHVTWETDDATNLGSMLQLKTDQKNHVPQYGVLRKDGVVYMQTYALSEPKWQLEIPGDEGAQNIASGVIEALGDLKTGNASFADRLYRAAETAAHEELSKILREIWEKVRT